MAVWAKLDGLKRQAEGQGSSLAFEKVAHKLQEPETAKALNSLGLSVSGIDEISKGAPMSEPKDREIVSAILVIVAEAIIKKNLD